MVKKQKKSNKRIAALFILAGLIIISVGGYFLYSTFLNKASSNKTYSFNLDITKAPGWWTGGSHWPDAKDFEGDSEELPNVSLIAFEGKDEASIVDGKCFVSASYYNETVDVNAALKTREDGARGDGSIAFEPIGTAPLTMQTPKGEITYNMHRYEFSGPGSETIQRGAQFAYIALDKGHLAIFGYCQEASQLNSTNAVLNAISFNKK